jgi:hypothetical protein
MERCVAALQVPVLRFKFQKEQRPDTGPGGLVLIRSCIVKLGKMVCRNLGYTVLTPCLRIARRPGNVEVRINILSRSSATDISQPYPLS